MFVQLSPLSLKLFSSVVCGCFLCVCLMTAGEGTHLVGKDSLSLCPFDTVLSGAVSRKPFWESSFPNINFFFIQQHVKGKCVDQNEVAGRHLVTKIKGQLFTKCVYVHARKWFKIKSILSRPLCTVAQCNQLPARLLVTINSWSEFSSLPYKWCQLHLSAVKIQIGRVQAV